MGCRKVVPGSRELQYDHCRSCPGSLELRGRTVGMLRVAGKDHKFAVFPPELAGQDLRKWQRRIAIRVGLQDGGGWEIMSSVFQSRAQLHSAGIQRLQEIRSECTPIIKRVRDRRDANEESSSKERKIDGFPMPKCFQHPGFNCNFWCDNCDVAICIQCADNPHHMKHCLLVLRHVIKDKIEESLYALSHLRGHSEALQAANYQCKEETTFLSKLISNAENGKMQSQKLEKCLKFFDPYLPALRELASDSDDPSPTNVDVKVLGALLKVLPERDCDVLELPSRMIFKTGHITNLENCSFSILGCGAKFEVFCYKNPVFYIMDNYSIYSFFFSFRCTSASKWPIKANIRIITNKYDEESQNTEQEELRARDNKLVTNSHIENDLIFPNSSVELEIKTRSFSHEINYVVEIYPTNAS